MISPHLTGQPRGFQRATARAALGTLRRKDGPRRFLVADEVGLGKTVVARTVIEGLMAGRRRPLVVFYISSNLNIAHQNRAKLLDILPTENQRKEARARADRLTLAADERKRPTHGRLHLYTLTPDTSVPMYRGRGGFGRVEERALIFRLLAGRFPSLAEGRFADICRGNQVKPARWHALTQQAALPGARELQRLFLHSLAGDDQLGPGVIDAASLLAAAEAERRPARFMGRLRSALAMAVVRDIQPDLVICDEFQKFRGLLIDPPGDTPDRVTLELRRGSASSRRHGLLLLSATPYRMYATRNEDSAEGPSPHEEFFELIRFLFEPDKEEPQAIERAFQKFGKMMQSPATPEFTELNAVRKEIERRLQSVLSRTERPGNAQEDEGAALQQHKCELQPEDLQVFKTWVARIRAGKRRLNAKVDPLAYAVPYWMSVPLPTQMLGPGYAAWRQAEVKRARRNEPALRREQRKSLKAPRDWPHPQLRALREIAPPSQLSLPWVAPSLPWWELKGPWTEASASGGKVLLFARFKATPPAVASLLSYNVEASLAGRTQHHSRAGARRSLYDRIGKAQPLQMKDDRPTLPALFFPWPTLIAFTDPLWGAPVSLPEVRKLMSLQVGDLVRKRLNIPIWRKGKTRPFWKLLPALERIRGERVLEGGLPSWPHLRPHLAGTPDRWEEAAAEDLEFLTQTELAALAEFALSGPGVVLGRVLHRFDPGCLGIARIGALAEASWDGLRSYPNRGIFHAVLTRRGRKYTEAIPQAVVAGNLESVLDEHLWIASMLDADAVRNFPRDLRNILGLHEGRHKVHEPGHEAGFHLRCHAALPFADAKAAKGTADAEQNLRTDDVRRAFNSPFWPHVLTTTSLGQEGLDFHVWCRRLLHWDLCASPVDLEQREGRIQRFGGLSVRAALAEQFRAEALMAATQRKSPWIALRTHAEQAFEHDASGRTPWWTCPNEKIERLCAVLPHSRRQTRYEELRKERWLYRLALGQPHPQDFVESVARRQDGREKFALRLSAWKETE